MQILDLSKGLAHVHAIRDKAVNERKCAWCQGEITGFRNAISEREFKISGFCQKCQDDIFGID